MAQRSRETSGQLVGMKDYQNTRAWFCIRSHPKHEHIASANLKSFLNVEVFCPRIRSRKLTRRGPVWMVESLFPNYLFVHFELNLMLSEVKYTSGVSHVLQFGGRYPTVADEVIESLRTSFAQEELQLSSELPVEGDEVLIADKAFWGMQAVVLRVMPAQDRIRVLIEMLGRATAVDLRLGSVVPALQLLPRPLLKM